MTVYHPFGQQSRWSGWLFVHAHGDPTRLSHRSANHPHPLFGPASGTRATLQDIRAEVLTPDRLNTLVFGGFAAVALVIAVVGAAGVLAFSVGRRDEAVRHPPGNRIGAAGTGSRRCGLSKVS